MIHGSVADETPSSRWMLGRAMLAMVTSRTSINCAVAMTIRDRPSPRLPGNDPGWPACMEVAVGIDELRTLEGEILSIGLHRADRQAEGHERHVSGVGGPVRLPTMARSSAVSGRFRSPRYIACAEPT